MNESSNNKKGNNAIKTFVGLLLGIAISVLSNRLSITISPFWCIWGVLILTSLTIYLDENNRIEVLGKQNGKLLLFAGILFTPVAIRPINYVLHKLASLREKLSLNEGIFLFGLLLILGFITALVLTLIQSVIFSYFNNVSVGESGSQVTILVADFEGSESSEIDDISSIIIRELKSNLDVDGVGVQVNPLGEQITETSDEYGGRDAAQRKLEETGADVLIWGYPLDLRGELVFAFEVSKDRLPSVKFSCFSRESLISNYKEIKISSIRTTGLLEEQVNSTSLLIYGLIQFQQGNYQDAAKSLENWITSLSDVSDETSFNQAVDAWVLLARSYLNSGQYDKAASEYDSIVALNATNELSVPINEVRAEASDSYYRLGDQYFDDNLYAEAIDALSKAISRNSKVACYYNNRGIVHERIANKYWNNEEFDKARSEYQLGINDYNEAIKIREDFPKAYNNRGFAYTRLDKYDQAIEDFDKAIQYQPVQCRAYRSCKNANVSQGTPYYSLEDYGEAFYNRGLAYQKKGEIEKAFRDYKETLNWSYDSKVRNNAIKELCKQKILCWEWLRTLV